MTVIKEKFFSFSNSRFLALLVGIASFLIYSNTIPNFYNLDDELITENHILKDGGTASLKKIFTEPYYKDQAGNKYEYRPIVLLFYFAEFSLFGKNPHLSHFINVVLYALTCALLFLLLLSLFRDIDEAQQKQPASKKSNTGLFGMPPQVMISIAITILFAVHPLHTEVVASIKNRDELLSLLFGILCWRFALKFADTKKIAVYLLYVLFFVAGIFSKQTSIAFAILAPVSVIMFRKVEFQTLLALILPIQLIAAIFAPIYLIYKKIGLFFGQIGFLILFYYFIEKRGAMIGFLKRILAAVTDFFRAIWRLIVKYFKAYSISVKDGIFRFAVSYKVLLGTILSLVVIGGAVKLLVKKKDEVKKVQWNVQDTFHDFNELQVTPALQTPAPTIIPSAGRKLNFAEIPLLYETKKSIRFGTSVLVLVRYLRLMLIPYPLRYYYGYGVVPLVDFKDARVPLSAIVYPVLFFLMLYLLVVRRQFIFAFGILFYLLAITPLSNLITPIAGIMAERLAYMPSLGFCIAFGYLLIYPVAFPQHKIFGMDCFRIARPILFLFGAVILTYGAMTISRNFYWKDHLTLMRHDIKHMKKSARGHHLLASHLAVKASEKKQHKLPENQKLLGEALVHFKKVEELYPDYPKVWYDMAKVHVLLGDNNSAIESYVNACNTDSFYAPPCFELGILQEQANRPRDAEDSYKQAIGRDSMFLQAYVNLSFLYYRQERYNESLDVNLQALRHLPNAYELYVNTGRVYLVMQNTPKALEYLEKAVSINRSDKSIIGMVADLYAQMGNEQKANYYRSLR